MSNRRTVDRLDVNTLKANLGEMRNAYNALQRTGGDMLTMMSSCIIVAKSIIDMMERMNTLEQELKDIRDA